MYRTVLYQLSITNKEFQPIMQILKNATESFY